MSTEDYTKYFDILELSPDASISDIKNAYLRLKKLYSTDSIVISPLADEFSKKRRREIIKQIEKSYLKLMALMENEHRKPTHQRESLVSDNVPEEEKADITSFSGRQLREIRKKLEIQLYEIAMNTKIGIEFLRSIELEKFDALPPEAYLKAYLRSYASCLFLNPKKVADDYLKRYKEWKKEVKEKS